MYVDLVCGFVHLTIVRLEVRVVFVDIVLPVITVIRFILPASGTLVSLVQHDVAAQFDFV